MVSTFFSIKGGVGKTSITLHTAGALSKNFDKKILLVDTDPQGNLSSVFIDDIYSLQLTVADIFKGNAGNPIIKTGSFPNIHIIPANIKLSLLQSALMSNFNSAFILKNYVEKVKNDYDFVFIDTHPGVDIFAQSALCASDYAILPCTPEDWAIDGTIDAMSFINDSIKENLNKDLEIAGLVVNLFKSARSKQQAYLKSIKEEFGDLVFPEIIGDYSNIADAISDRLPLAYKSGATKEKKVFNEIAREFLARVE